MGERSEKEASASLVERLNALLSEGRELGQLEELRAAFEQFSKAAAAGDRAAEREAAGSGEESGRFGMIGMSAPMLATYDLIERVAASNVAVLIQGETGTGKELVAKALHLASARAKKPFLAENCAAIPANLLESELFGHTKGAFTGAVAERPGHFVAADGGTVFLDEIGDMPVEMQAKLLRVLEQGEVRPVGADKVRKVNVRVLAATHRDLASAARDGDFREDLYYRLNVVTVALPPLRERAGDVALLAQFFLERAAAEYERPRPTLTADALAALEGHSWPGNVRELENEIRRAVALSGATIDRDSLSDALLESAD